MAEILQMRLTNALPAPVIRALNCIADGIQGHGRLADAAEIICAVLLAPILYVLYVVAWYALS